jgi:hypothetical protein
MPYRNFPPTHIFHSPNYKDPVFLLLSLKSSIAERDLGSFLKKRKKKKEKEEGQVSN